MEQTSTLLIVDDTETNIRLLEKMLEESYRIRSALSGEEALQRIEVSRPDLILLDVMMPGMDGYEVCRRLKENPKTKQIPVIFITSVDDADGETKGLALGAVDYITKPFNLAITKARIQTHLEMKHLYEERLIYKQKLFEEQRCHSINELMVNISHHWRQPLNMISLGVDAVLMDLAKQTCSSDEITDNLQEIKKTALELSLTIDLFQRYQPSKRNYNRSLFPYKIINDIIQMHRDKLQSANLQVVNNVNEKLELRGDTSIFLNIILSLIENSAEVAIDRMVKKPQITFSAVVESGQVKLTAEDNCGGIDANPASKIFDPYFTTFFKSRGKGLSLYMTKMGVEEYLGGSIHARNITGGARFTLQLPLPKNRD